MMKLITQWQQTWRIAEMRLLFLALLVSVVAITSVGFFTDRADKEMTRQATELMGGDLIVSSSRPIPQQYLDHAQQLGLQTAQMISFPSMASSGDKLQLVQVRAVSEHYPLTGHLETSASLLKQTKTTAHKQLSDQQAWAEAHLFIALDLAPPASIQLGKTEIQLTQQLVSMPGQGMSAFQIAPVLLISLKQLPATGLLTPASRARFNQLFAGEAQQLNAFKTWLKPQLQSTEKIRSLEEGLPAVEQALQRGKRFLSLAALLSVILAGAAIALTSHSLNQRETRTVAVLKTLGASRRTILHRYLTPLLLTSSLAAILGSLLGYVIQLIAIYWLQDKLGQSLPSAGFFPVITGFLTAYIMLLGFSIPQLSKLLDISPTHILQGNIRPTPTAYRMALFAIMAGSLCLMWIQTNDIRLSLFLLVITLIATLLFWLLAKSLLGLLQRVKQNTSQGYLLPKPNPRMVLLIVVFGIGLFSLLLLTALRLDLVERWQATLPEASPNHFLINIQPDEIKPLQTLFKQQQKTASLYPMVRGRLIAINNKPVKATDYSSEHTKRLATREFNISTATDLPDHNSLVSGQWFVANKKPTFSVEKGLAEALGLTLRDVLRFDVAGQHFTANISSIREVRWDSMQPSFFVLAPIDALADYPRTYITSLYVAKDDKHFLPNLIHRYPSITDIDLNAIMLQVKGIMEKATLAVQAIFSFTLLAGILVLFAALQSQKAERRKEIAILKSIGASHRSLRNSLLLEFTLIGAIAGFIAAILAVISSNLAGYFLFDLPPSMNYLLILFGLLAGAILVGTAGYLNLRPLLKIPPIALFQMK